MCAILIVASRRREGREEGMGRKERGEQKKTEGEEKKGGRKEDRDKYVK